MLIQLHIHMHILSRLTGNRNNVIQAANCSIMMNTIQGVKYLKAYLCNKSSDMKKLRKIKL